MRKWTRLESVLKIMYTFLFFFYLFKFTFYSSKLHINNIVMEIDLDIEKNVWKPFSLFQWQPMFPFASRAPPTLKICS